MYMKAYEIEVEVKLTIFAFNSSDATDAVEEAIREVEGLGAEIKTVSFTSIKEI